MRDNDLVTAWKNPASRSETGTAHPAGSIRLGAGAVVGRRAQLLAGLANTEEEASTVFPTYSLSLTSWGGGGY
ncbi:hypothetical protein [Streptomyces malaysiense]|uniref:Uncharacterized protein n=1 Tax=Streptomyces malaysiense TaxID=1428626 RepID=A0A1J4Q517_9ACTN|nr:hypothetical protein [Streptomyces malaysiense]OIK27462.1 hypothetical protein VT52_011975 [Streptomyces malaysiense]